MPRVTTGVDTALAELRARLEAHRAELLSALHLESDALATPTEERGEDLSASQHPADVAGDLVDRESLLSLGRLHRRELEQVERALTRMRHGTYGWCADCRGEIPLERLRAFPQAEHCVTCARQTAHASLRARRR